MRWYSLHLQWGAWLLQVLRPPGVLGFVRAAQAAVPLNVVISVLVSIALAAVAFDRSGSRARDDTFQIAFVLLTAGPVVGHLVRAVRTRLSPAGAVGRTTFRLGC